MWLKHESAAAFTKAPLAGLRDVADLVARVCSKWGAEAEDVTLFRVSEGGSVTPSLALISSALRGAHLGEGLSLSGADSDVASGSWLVARITPASLRAAGTRTCARPRALRRTPRPSHARTSRAPLQAAAGALPRRRSAAVEVRGKVLRERLIVMSLLMRPPAPPPCRRAGRGPAVLGVGARLWQRAPLPHLCAGADTAAPDGGGGAAEGGGGAAEGGGGAALRARALLG